jgi:anti-sigma B factor antagonist
VAELSGEIDLSNADDLAAAIRARVSNHAMGVVVDLTEVRFIDSSGLAILFVLGRRLRSRRQELRVVVPPESTIRTVVELVDLSTAAGIDDSIDAALKELRGPATPGR